MSYDGTLSFDTSLNLKGFEESVKKIQSFVKNTKGFFTSVTKGIDATGLLAQKLTLLTGSGGSGDSAEAALARLEDSALSAQYGFGTAAAAVDDLVTHGMSLNGAIQAVTAWGDAVATYAGGSSGALTSVTGTLADLQTAGTVSMNHVNALMDAGIPVAETYAAAMGTSVSQALTALGSGTVNAASFLAAMNSAIENGAGSLPALAGAATQVSTTWSGAFAHMQDSVVNGVAAILRSFDEANTRVGNSPLADSVKKLGNIFGGILQGMARAIEPILRNLSALSPLILEVVISFGAAKIITPILKEIQTATNLVQTAQKAAKKSTKNLTIATREQTNATKEQITFKNKAYAADKERAAAEALAKGETIEAIAAQKIDTEVTKQDVAANMASSGAISMKTLLLGGLTGKLGLATVATTLMKGATQALSAAFNAMGGGLGIALTALSLFAGVFSGVIKSFFQGSTEFQEHKQAVEDAAAAYEDFSAAVTDSKKDFDSSQASLKNQKEKTKELTTTLAQLSGKENKSAADKAALAQTVALLNHQFDGLNLSIDEETGALSRSAGEVTAYVQAQQQISDSEAILQRHSELLQEQQEAEQKLKELKQQRLEIDAQFEAGTIPEGKRKELLDKLTISEDGYLQQQKDIGAELNELNAGQAAAQAAFAQESIDILNQQAAAEAEAQQKRADAIGSFTEAATNMFDAVNEKSDVSVEQMIENLRKNGEAMQNYETNMGTLRERFSDLGLDTAVLDQLANMGPEGIPYVAELVTGTDDQLRAPEGYMAQDMDRAFQAGITSTEKNAILSEEAMLQAGARGVDTYGAEMSKLPDKVAGSMAETDQAAADAAVGMVDDVRGVMGDAIEQADFAQNGTQIVTKTSGGVTESTPALTKAAETAVADTQNAALDAVETQPFVGIGQTMVQEIIDGVNDMKGGLTAAVLNAVSAARTAAARMWAASSFFLPKVQPTGRSGGPVQPQAEPGEALPARADARLTLPAGLASRQAPGIVARLQAVVTAQQSQYAMGGARQYSPAVPAQPAAASPPREVKNYYNVSIDAKNVKEFNDVVKAAQRAVMSYRQGYVGY